MGARAVSLTTTASRDDHRSDDEPCKPLVPTKDDRRSRVGVSVVTRRSLIRRLVDVRFAAESELLE